MLNLRVLREAVVREIEIFLDEIIPRREEQIFEKCQLDCAEGYFIFLPPKGEKERVRGL